MTRRIARTHAPATLEKQAIGFTIGLYTFIILTMLALHYLAPLLPQTDSAAPPAPHDIPALIAHTGE